MTAFWCLYLQKPSFIQVPWIAERLLTSKIDHTKIVDIHKASKIQVIREKEDIANVDGEAVMMAKDITVEIFAVVIECFATK